MSSHIVGYLGDENASKTPPRPLGRLKRGLDRGERFTSHSQLRLAVMSPLSIDAARGAERILESSSGVCV